MTKENPGQHEKDIQPQGKKGDIQTKQSFYRDHWITLIVDTYP